ncbi:PREDICTED: A disintegrin and metalloproteinase with thrombospondin motifs 9 [Dufourea novaeangliae]|uniref:A disintegrin and metalloproteinase with thrombospondin motifs 9 n=1 Tax=Dufourea novaeangliae TaxID=178035 RepID=UPI0007677585|nr:PREDICTED: A disintegrin and metalloproteinase with thrombospondin motifs 9 [Dufourea novaeangliae]
MSRISSRVSNGAAALGVVLLVVFIVILWTGVHTSNEEIEADGRLDPGTQALDGLTKERLNETSTIRSVTFHEESFSNEVIPKSETISRKQDKPDLEYIKLRKINGNQYEDTCKVSTSQNQHSGHFRHATAEVWDTYPQYEFTAFGRQFRLRLAHDTSFVSPNIKITHMSTNSSRREHPGNELGCFYSGTVDDDPYSVVTVSLCHGMTGHVRTSTGSYIIKPAEPWQGNDKDSLDSSLQHEIQRMRTRTKDSNHVYDADDQRSHNCGVIDHDTSAPILDDTTSDIKVYAGGRTRRRRSLSKKRYIDYTPSEEENQHLVGQSVERRGFLQSDEMKNCRYYTVERRRNDPREVYSQVSEMESDPFVTWRPRRALPRKYFIEIMVAADAEMVKYHGKNLTRYILVLMHTVSQIYKDQSIGNPIIISVMKIVQADILFATRRSRRGGVIADDMLKQFCHWQKSNNTNVSSPDHHDAALLLTRHNLCHKPEDVHCDTLGLAKLGQVCAPRFSCAIVMDNGLSAAYTIAHEIGHLLNMPHDDEKQKCSKYVNGTHVQNIMSTAMDNNTYPWEWSNCSRHYVTDFLEAGHGDCLLDEPDEIMEKEDTSRLPGEDYSTNRQCELSFGAGSRFCPRLSKVCKKLWCTAPGRDDRGQCYTEQSPWADGTPCADGKWCYRGKCVSRRNLEPVDGQWGEWGPYGPCSRTCGGGVQKKKRECNNPPPEHGGNYCVGDSVYYSSCGTDECPPGSPDFRGQQCSGFDNNTMDIENLPRDVKWFPKYLGISPENRCRLYCQTISHQNIYEYKMRDKVIDGTPCGLDSFDVCVNGYCKPAGCDHVLDSTAELDTCGVCRGDNSTCQRITGSYNYTNQGYRRVTTIPAGSSHIDIRQHGWMGLPNDTNYLALKLAENGKYILNGHSKLMLGKVIAIVESGITIEYSGPDSVVERLNSSRSIGTDLILEVLVSNEYKPPQITYEYTVPKKILNSYAWVLSNWSECSHICKGMKYRKAECRNTENKDIVSNDYCRKEERPREESQICNNHCNLKWQITSTNECSSHCGLGTRTVTSKCVQILLNSDERSHPIQERACAHLKRPNQEEPCTGPCDSFHWNYTEWGSCSVTCGNGVQHRTAICVNSNERHVPANNCDRQEKHLTRPCAQTVCPKWDFGNWDPCSVKCGIGKQHRYYFCHVNGRVVPNNHCGDPPSGITRDCNAGPCKRWQSSDWSSVNLTPNKYSSDPPHEGFSPQDNEVDDISFHFGYQWQVGSYKECSRACIGGFINRVVKCVSNNTGIIAPDVYCDKKKKPSTRIACNRHQCPDWHTTDWSQCSVKCGSGFQHRYIRCQSPNGTILPNENCHESQKPTTVQVCYQAPCMTGRKHHSDTNIYRTWKTSTWSACSKSCGSGLQRRRVECTIRRGNHGPQVTVKDEQCTRLGLNKPRSQRPCRRVACDYIWQEGAWSECSEKCGEGIQRRTVTCHHVDSSGFMKPTPSDNCPLDQKPSTKQICKLQECDDKYIWNPGRWRKCSHTCGQKGRQTRRLFCRERTSRKKVNHRYCPLQFKPKRKRKCNQRKCYPISCLDAKDYYRTNIDSEYSLLVGGRNMSIYCHDMSTSQPKEYLTLPAGSRENYAEIYDKRLIDSQSCPYNRWRNNNSCGCATNTGSISGKTMFRRVRIDPIKLYILESDSIFSWTTGEKRIKYGMTGDCYSHAYCYQGRFSINLSGTQLKLSSDVTWRRTPGASMEINKISSQHVTGKCGGYCGFCSPDIGLKLDVLPP